MARLKINTDPKAKVKLDEYPKKINEKITALRKLIIEVAKENSSISEIEETLKWGELSYISQHGSTLRIDWKEKNPTQYALYFSCTSQLVPTFKIVFGNTFMYEKNRAIIFDLDESLPRQELKKCIEAALVYHKVKKYPLLNLA